MIYISGAVTGTDDYVERFEKAEKYFTHLGYDVVNPVKINEGLPSITPYMKYIEVSLALLRNCGAIYMLNGWENSKGARLEHAYAECAGMTIMYEKDETEEKKYYWRLNGNFNDELTYINFYRNNKNMLLSTKREKDGYKTKFTESEYKELAKGFGFPEDMFVKEEIE